MYTGMDAEAAVRSIIPQLLETQPSCSGTGERVSCFSVIFISFANLVRRKVERMTFVLRGIQGTREPLIQF